MPEIQDLKTSVKSVGSFGEFSVIGFTMVGLGDPREVRAGVVDGSYFEVMGLRPVLGRLLDQRDDGPGAAPACVLTYSFWKDSLKGDPTMIGKSVRLDTRTATIVGVLEPWFSIRRRPRSLTSSPARIISRPPWSPNACIA